MISISTVRRQSRRSSRTARAALALVAALAVVAPAVPAAAAEAPSNQVRYGTNLTLVVANCPSPADNAVAQALARHARNAAAVCIESDGLSPETAALIAEFAPDRVLVVGGESAVLPAVMDELTAAVRAAYRWTVVERLGGTSRVETAAAAARAALERPEVAGPNTVTLIVANGWNSADVRTAAAFAAVTADAAVAYISPNTIADGLPAATASLIADYRPARVVIVGLADAVGSATETAVEAALDDIGQIIEIERVAEAGEPRATIPETSPSVPTARAIFTAIRQGERSRVPAGDTSLPYVGISKAAGGSGWGERLWTMRADGSDRQLRSDDHNGWSWNPRDGSLGWAEVDGRLIVSTVDGDTNVLFEPAGYPVWSPDGNGVVAFELSDSDGNGRVDRIEAYVAESDGRRIRSLGRVAYRTLLFANVPGAFWSPDGQHFAYVGLITDPDTGATKSRAHIESMDSNAPALTLGDDVTFFGWSPHGRHITYGTSSDCDGDGGDDSQNLWIAKPDGGSARDLGLIDRIQWRSVQLWSPDGTHIAYEALDPADCSMQLHIQAASGDSGALAMARGGRFLGWSPNSTHLGYAVTVGTPGAGVPLQEHTWVARRDGSDTRRLGEVQRSIDGELLWSPDGSHVAYNAALRDADGNRAGTQPRIERSNGIGGSGVIDENGNVLEWSRGGKRLAYVAHYDDDSNGVVDRRALRVHTVGSLGAEVTLVDGLPDITLGARWSPDGAYIGYVSGPTQYILDWFIRRRQGHNAWFVAIEGPRWTHRLMTDVAWGEWQPR
ncbi:hypothetical protein [Candidatus Poriferisodalis sp.]|uniref:hypothetical protein n=1 Tax=Candidatus Poriferisodalis sp. TaxID=3101277 RepID=UPI003B0143D4